MSHFTGEETEAQIGNSCPGSHRYSMMELTSNPGSLDPGPQLFTTVLSKFSLSLLVSVLLISNVAHALQQTETRNQWQKEN